MSQRDYINMHLKFAAELANAGSSLTYIWGLLVTLLMFKRSYFFRCPSYLARLKLTKNNYSDRASRFIAETLFKAPVNLKATLRCLGQEERCQCSRDTVNETVSFKIKSIRKKTDAF